MTSLPYEVKRQNTCCTCITEKCVIITYLQSGEVSVAELSLGGEADGLKSRKSSSSSSIATTAITADTSVSTATSVTGDLKQIVNEEKRRSARRREFIMAELLDTERSYVKDLELTVKCFKRPLEAGDPDAPQQLRGRSDVVFGNIEEILLFHKSTFLKELEKYETMAEDVGHCFVTWVGRNLRFPSRNLSINIHK